jgi:hypothetical protein
MWFSITGAKLLCVAEVRANGSPNLKTFVTSL